MHHFCHHRFQFEDCLRSVDQFVCPILHVAGLKWKVWPTAGLTHIRCVTRAAGVSLMAVLFPQTPNEFWAAVPTQLPNKPQPWYFQCKKGNKMGGKHAEKWLIYWFGSVWRSQRFDKPQGNWRELCRAGGARRWLQTGVHGHQKRRVWKGTAPSRQTRPKINAGFKNHSAPAVIVMWWPHLLRRKTLILSNITVKCASLILDAFTYRK